jgi:4-hydroxybenzoate polyprenyltransferase
MPVLFIPETMARRIIQHIAWYCYNTRFFDWRAYLGITVLGFVHGLNGMSSFYVNPYLVAKFLISIALYFAFTFSINNCFDAKCDAYQREKLKKNPIAAGLIGFREGLALSLFTGFIGLALTYIWFNEAAFFLYALLISLGMAYSIPPLRLKSVPVIDLVSHGLFFGLLLFLFGLQVAGGWIQTPILGVSIFLCSVTFELRNHLEDLKADNYSGTKTTACWLGPSKARRLLKFLLVIHWLLLGAVLWTIDFQFCLAVIGIAIPIFIFLPASLFVRIGDVFSSAVYAYSALSHVMGLLAG